MEITTSYSTVAAPTLAVAQAPSPVRIAEPRMKPPPALELTRLSGLGALAVPRATRLAA